MGTVSVLARLLDNRSDCSTFVLRIVDDSMIILRVRQPTPSTTDCDFDVGLPSSERPAAHTRSKTATSFVLS